LAQVGQVRQLIKQVVGRMAVHHRSVQLWLWAVAVVVQVRVVSPRVNLVVPAVAVPAKLRAVPVVREQRARATREDLHREVLARQPVVVVVGPAGPA
jgi:hypothetical protein